ncbi:predicted protein [Chaetoceros tenuissimus]|uniref:Phospholipase A2 n=1 Tax=Chaetoceros tenuissimus TaxID=426638 RepID=A0AAD3HAW8_9STRA|nr:predicted protein [Chaetoceros tenuissimus]
MKYLRACSIPILPIITAFLLPTDVLASCTPEDKVECVEHAGTCTAAVDAFFADDTAQAVALLDYGKFCGIQESKCRAADPDRADLDIEPCNEIDAACAAHDQCFRDATIYGEGQPYKTPEDTCVCNITFVQSLLALALSGYSPPIEICDKEYYTKYSTIPEAVLIVIPFCISIQNCGLDPEGLVTNVCTFLITTYT